MRFVPARTHVIEKASQRPQVRLPRRTADKAALAVHRLDQPFGKQRCQRLAHGDAADAEFSHQLRLRRQLDARSPFVVDDALAQRAFDLLEARQGACCHEIGGVHVMSDAGIHLS